MRTMVVVAVWALLLLTAEGEVRAEARLAWKHRVGVGALRTPTFHDGMLYVGGSIGERQLVALRAVDGAVQWQSSLRDHGPTSAVAVDHALVLGSESCHVHVVDARSGQVIWERYMGEFVTATPAVAGERIYAVHMDREAWALTALDLTDGDVVWSTPLRRNVLDAVVVAGEDVLVTTDDGTVRAFRIEDGSRRWEHDVDALGAPVVWGPWVHVVTWPRDEHGFVSIRMHLTFPEPEERRAQSVFDHLERSLNAIGACGFSGLGGVRVHPNGARSLMPGSDPRLLSCLGVPLTRALTQTPRAQWPRSPWSIALDRGTQHATVLARRSGRVVRRTEARTLGHLPRPTETLGIQEQWHYEGQRASIADGVAYEVVGSFLIARSLDATRVVWSEPLDRRVTLPAIAGDLLVHGTEDGKIVARSRGDGRVQFSVDVGAPVASQPILSPGFVFGTTTTGEVFAIAAEGEINEAWPMWGGTAAH